VVGSGAEVDKPASIFVLDALGTDPLLGSALAELAASASTDRDAALFFLLEGVTVEGEAIVGLVRVGAGVVIGDPALLVSAAGLATAVVGTTGGSALTVSATVVVLRTLSLTALRAGLSGLSGVAKELTGLLADNASALILLEVVTEEETAAELGVDILAPGSGVVIGG
jgi:hypothetical protein